MTLVAQFLAANPNTSLQTADLFSSDALAGYTWPEGADKKQTLQQLRTRQRLLKLHPDERVAAVLEDLGFHSAHHIAATGAAAFAEQAAPQLAALDHVPDGAALCAALSGRAERIRRSSLELALVQPAAADAASGTGASAAPDFQQGTPDYQRLFGPSVTCDCDDCQSIFSPAAYFTDLMRVVSQYIAQPGEEAFTLAYRRPDLWDLPLDCNSATAEVRYLDVVNAILKQNLRTNFTSDKDPMQEVASNVYPFNAPYVEPLEIIRAGLEGLGTSLEAVYHTLNTAAPAATTATLNLSPESRSLVTGTNSSALWQQYGLYEAPSDNYQSLSLQQVFLKQTGLKPEALEGLVFQNLKQGNDGYAFYNTGTDALSTTGFSNAALTDSITVECWVYPQAVEPSLTILEKGANSELYLFLDNNRLLNCQYGIDGSTTPVALKSRKALTPNTWTHVAWKRNLDTGENKLFINGVKDTTYTETTKSAAKSSSNAIGIGSVATAGSSVTGALAELRLWQVARTGEQIRAHMYARLNDYSDPDLFAYWPLNAATNSTVAKDYGTHGYNATLSGNAVIDFRIFDSLPLGHITEINPTLAHSFYLNNVLGGGQYLTLADPSYTANAPASRLAPARIQITDGTTNTDLTTTALRQIAAFIRLREATGWSFEDLDWVLRSVAGLQATINDTVMEDVARVQTLHRQYNIPLDELTALWYDMKTYGRGNAVEPEDLWDRVFNTPPLMAGSANAGQGAYYRPLYAANPIFSSTVLTWTFENSAEARDQQLSNQLAAALGVSGSDLALLVKSVVNGRQSTLQLTVQNLSQLYRLARFAKMLGRRVPDFLRLTAVAGLGLSYNKAKWSLAEVNDVCAYDAWLKKARLRTEQIAYLTTADAPTDSLQLPATSAVDKALEGMANASTPVRITPASFITPDVDALTAQKIYNQLQDQLFIDATGLVLNVHELTLPSVYRALTVDQSLAQQILKTGLATSVVNFISTDGDTVCFPFDPFADATIQANNAFTISLWVRSTATSNSKGRLVGNVAAGHSDGSGVSPTIAGFTSDQPLLVNCSDHNGAFDSLEATDFQTQPGEWVYVSWVNEAGVWSLYRNGQLVPGTSYSQTPFSAPYCQPADTATYYVATGFDGSVSNVTIWNTARTADELEQDMFAIYSGIEPGLVAYWPMDEGEGATIHNLTPFGGIRYNGTFTGWNETPDWVPNSALASVIAIWQALVAARDGQVALVVQTLAGVAGLGQDVMAGACALTSGEVDNGAALRTLGHLPYAVNLLLNPDAATNPNREAYLQQLQRNSALAKWFHLTGEEASDIVAYSKVLGTQAITYGTTLYTADQLATLSTYKSLQQLCNTENGLIDYFKGAPAGYRPNNDQLALLAQLTGWNATELQKVVQSSLFSAVDFNSVAGLRKLADVMALEQQLDMGMASLALLSAVATYTAAANWASYNSAAAAVTAALTTKAGASVVAAQQGARSEQVRTVLADWLTWELGRLVDGVRNREELYEYLLIDTSMSQDVTISWTVAAMNSLQLYVNRCISSLEPGTTNTIPAAWWGWMSTYREWQANREVYLYPENYVDPSLRTFQSGQFRQFISDVSKGPVTNENVSKALASYLESVAEVSSLEIVDAYIDAIQTELPGSAPGNARNALFLIGKSRTEPAVFYSRTALAVTSVTATSHGVHTEDATYMDFGPWQQINLQINAPYVSTAVAFGRQFIFWVEQSLIVNTEPEGGKYTSVYATIYYSYRDFNDNWIEPAILKKDILIEVFGGSANIHFFNTFLLGATLDNPNTDTPYPYYTWKQWSRVSVQTMPATNKQEEQILVLLGDLVYCPASKSSQPTPQNTSGMTKEAAEYQKLLYRAAVFARQHAPHYTTIIPACTLNASFQKKTYPVWFDANGSQFVDYTGFTNADERYEVAFWSDPSPLQSTDRVPPPIDCWPMTHSTEHNFVSGTSLVDAVGTNNGTLSTNPTWLHINNNPRFPNVQFVQYTGTNYGYIPASDYIANTHFTISCWVYLTSTNNQNVLSMFYKSGTTGSTDPRGGWDISVYNKKFQFGYGTAGAEVVTNQFGTVEANTWYYLALSVDGTSMTATINGTRHSMSGSYSAITFSVSSPRLYLGSCTQVNGTYQNSNYGNLHGTIINLKYWNEVLTTAQLKQEYLSGSMEYFGSNPAASLQRIGNSFAAFIYNNDAEAYLCLPVFPSIQTKGCIHPSVTNQGTVLKVSFINSPVSDVSDASQWQLVRINTDAVAPMIRVLATQGVKGLLGNLKYQSLPETPPVIQSKTGQLIRPASEIMNFNGAFGVYFWEIFFYVPYLIAEKLRSTNSFNDAQTWYQYIFTPNAGAAPALTEQETFIQQNVFAGMGAGKGPVAYWPINGHRNGKFPDLVGDRGATYSGVTETKGATVPFSAQPRSVWKFSGSMSGASIPHTPLLNPTAAFTVAAWMRLDAIPAGTSFYSIFTSQRDYTGYQFCLWTTNNQWHLTLTNGTGTAWVSARSPDRSLSTDEWLYVAASFDGSRMRVFINGADVTQSAPLTMTGFVPNTTTAQEIGAGSSVSTTSNALKGTIAEVAFFNYAVGVEQMAHLYQSYRVLYQNSNFWRFRPFRRLNGQSLYHILNGDAWEESFFQPAAYYNASLQMVAYEYDPFDPDAIARLRINSWQKATFMRYVQNLISWGDSLFTQDSWETRSDATMRYVLAESLLGRKPVKKVVEAPQPAVTYGMIEAEYSSSSVPPFLIEMENQLSGLGPDATLPQQVQSLVDAYFCVPANKQLLQYWELVADRLYKLRHGLTIAGAPDDVPLFAAPLDPAALVATRSNGVAPGAATPQVPLVPWFRFSYLVAQAKSLAAEVSRLGGELLGALEKGDAEYLSQLQSGYQVVLFNLTAQIKAAQVNQLRYVGKGLQESLENAEYLYNTYKHWIAGGMDREEISAMVASAAALIAQDVAMGFHMLSAPAYLAPDIFGLADGGMQFGQAIAVGGVVAEGIAQMAGTEGQMLTQMSQYVRRSQEWDLQKNMAANQAKEIRAQIAANEFALKAAQQESAVNTVQLQQSQTVSQFLQTKFTNQELYGWMADQVRTLYFQTYQLAWSLAQSAQTALQYELNSTQTYLNPASWNSNYQGLLAADALSLALQQMETAYIAGKNRKLEIRKTWSLRQNNPEALQALITGGACRFALGEQCYDLDFPGHYDRKIKSLSITIPAVVGPYQNIHATLVQTGNTVVTKPSIDAVKYLTGDSTTPPDDGSLRINWSPNQEIAISTGVNDAGVFQVNFNDEQYLPFEGTGAVSSWSLSMPQAANAFPLRSVSDVIITVEYTAQDGGSTFRTAVTGLDAINTYKGFQYLSLRQQFSTAWFEFCSHPANGTYTLSFELAAQMYPANLNPDSLTLGNSTNAVGVFLATAAGTTPADTHLQLNGGGSSVWPLPDHQLKNGGSSGLPAKGTPWTLQLSTVPGSLLTDDGKIDPAKLLDIVLVIPFSGGLSWLVR